VSSGVFRAKFIFINVIIVVVVVVVIAIVCSIIVVIAVITVAHIIIYTKVRGFRTPVPRNLVVERFSKCLRCV